MVSLRRCQRDGCDHLLVTGAVARGAPKRFCTERCVLLNRADRIDHTAQQTTVGTPDGNERKNPMTDTPTTAPRRRPRTKRSGSIYKPKKKGKETSRFWWISYTSGGERHYESSESEKKGDAQKLLTDRLGDSGKGIAVSAKVGKITLTEGLQAVIDDQKAVGRKSIAHTQRRIDLHLFRPFGPDRRMATIGGAEIPEPGTTHGSRGLALDHEPRTRGLASGFRLARKHGALVVDPGDRDAEGRQRASRVSGARGVRRHRTRLPAEVQAPLRFAYLTGWRLRSEVLSLTADRVDLHTGSVRLSPGTTKNGKGARSS